MTLIEIMIVVGLIALLTGTLLFGSGILQGANRRAAATLIMAGVRTGLAHANTTGKPVRLTLDFDAKRIILEESSSRSVLREDPKAKQDEDFDVGKSLLEDAEALAESVLSGAGGPQTSYSPVDALGQDGDGPGRELGSGLRFVRIQTEHDEEPITEGRAHLHFWPGGVTERAVVQIARLNDEIGDGLTVVVTPLTGRAVIERGLIDLPEELFDEDEEFSEREE